MQYIKIRKFVRHTGTSLTHLLITSLIGSIIMLIIFHTYVFTKKQTNIMQQQITALYNQNITDVLLRQTIQNAGYKGPVSTILLPQSSTINYAYNNHVIPKAPLATCLANYNDCKDFVTPKILKKIIEQKIKPNTNLLLVYDIPEPINILTENMNNPGGSLKFNHIDKTINIGDHMIIADHNHIQRFLVSNIDQNHILHEPPYNTMTDFIKNFEQGSEIFKIKNMAFYIGKNHSYKNTNWSLYMEDFSVKSRAESILDDIEDLSIQIIVTDNKTKSFYIINNSWIFNKYILININHLHHISISIQNGYL